MSQATTVSETMNVRIPKVMKDGLEALAKSTQRSKSFLTTEALDAYLKENAWQVEAIKEAIAELDAGAPTIPHEEVGKWVRSLVTKNPLPRPTA